LFIGGHALIYGRQSADLEPARRDAASLVQQAREMLAGIAATVDSLLNFLAEPSENKVALFRDALARGRDQAEAIAPHIKRCRETLARAGNKIPRIGEKR
jgi:hypothetical protein